VCLPRTSNFTKAAEVLNSVSDAFSKAVSDIDEAFKRLNLGIVAWVQVHEDGPSSDDPVYQVEEIGYAKLGNKWGIAVRARTGNIASDRDEENVDVWPFNEATRALRLRAIEKLPNLVNKLSQLAAQMTKELQVKLADTQAVASALNPPKRRTTLTAQILANPTAPPVSRIRIDATGKVVRGVIEGVK
jgi:hypothetical protein